MTNLIPIFPLGIIVYPGEKLNLHIFEPRYKQLVNDCYEGKKTFGIPAVVNDKVQDMGSTVAITEITKRYDDGQLDIKTEGQEVFKILELIRDLPEKLYSGAIVNYPENITRGSNVKMKTVVEHIRMLHAQLNVTKDFDLPDAELTSYAVAHHAGLSLEDEYHLLELPQELQRLEFLKRHLEKVLPIMKDMDLLKGKIKMNGHFKNLEGFKFP